MRTITLFLLCAALVCFSSSARAQQLPGNPNSGLITVSSSVVNALNPYTNKTDGTINIEVSGTLTNYGTLNNQRYLKNWHQLNNESGGTLTNELGGMLTNYGTLDNDGTLTNELGGMLTNYGTLDNDGTLTNELGGMLYNMGTLNNNGTLNNEAGETHWHNWGTLNNNGTLTNALGGTLYNMGPLTNYGTLNNNGTLTNYGTLYNNATLTNALGGTLTGTGHINGNVYGSGTIAPGNSAGVFTIDGHLTHYDGGHQIELGGIFNGGRDHTLTEFDWLDVTGDVELAGTLEVYLIDSFELLAGMSFEILKVGGTLTGQYDGLDEGRKVGSFSGTNLYITYAGGEGNSVTLFSRAVPEPAALLLALFGLALLPRRRRR